MCMTFPIAVSTIGIKSCWETNREDASKNGGYHLPEDERTSSRVPNIERSKILAGASLLVGTCHHSQLPSHPRRSGEVRRLWNIDSMGRFMKKAQIPTDFLRQPPNLRVRLYNLLAVIQFLR